MINVKPTKNRVIIHSIPETSNAGIRIVAKRQHWRGKILAVGEDTELALYQGDIIRFQPMKNRTDLIEIDGRELISVPENWIYLREDESGYPLEVYKNLLVLTMTADREKIGSFWMPEHSHYDIAKVIMSADVLCNEVYQGDEVLVKKIDFWQFYRCRERWLFLSDYSNVLAKLDRT